MWWLWRRAAPVSGDVPLDPAAAERIAAAEAAVEAARRQARERRALTERLRRTREENDLAARVREAFGGEPR